MSMRTFVSSPVACGDMFERTEVNALDDPAPSSATL